MIWLRSIAPYIAAIAVVALTHYIAYSHGVDVTEARYKAAVADAEKAESKEYATAVTESEKRRAAAAKALGEAHAKIDDLANQLASGAGRVYVRAKCPKLSETAVPSGTGAGAAELDPAASGAYVALRRGLEQQYKDLQTCRAELRARSAP